MKTVISVLVFIIVYGNLAAQKNLPNTNAKIIAPVTKLHSHDDSIQYALGAYIGQIVINTGFYIINPTMFLSGMDDMFRNRKRLIPDSSIMPMLTAYQKKAKMQASREQELQLFTSLDKKPGIIKLPGGVRYVVLKAGEGAKPLMKDSVLINFKGTLTDGTVFEDTYAKKIFLATTPATLIPGLQAVLPLMSEGAIWEVYIPAAMAYGTSGNGDTIPPGSALIIQVGLVQLLPSKK